MSRVRSVLPWLGLPVVVLLALGGYLGSRRQVNAGGPALASFAPKTHKHLDHSHYFTAPFTSPQEVTRACLKCHPRAADEVMATPHWQWLGDSVAVPGHAGRMRIGKKNLMNNFCITVTGNLASCTKCHAGYGWSDSSFDFKRGENVDCLVCHEHSGAYVKGSAGVPDSTVDLLAAARSVGFPKRENCSVCHSYGGGGQAVKHGDLDGSLENPGPEDDVHMGKYGFLCIDCHRAKKHRIPGRAFSVSVEDAHGLACTDCHRQPPHRDPRLNAHLRALACQSCHIPTYARKIPTKTNWDWSQAGDSTRADDPHHYLRIKGAFVYGHDLVPEYAWFNRSTDRYLVGDRIDTTQVTVINPPRGDIHDTTARIWPFKVHRGLLPYDRQSSKLVPPILSGPGGFWHEFNWGKALALGAKASGMPFSGRFGFAKTSMYWPLSHMVSPKEKAMSCDACHGTHSVMDWKALGYEGDPVQRGGRR